MKNGLQGNTSPKAADDAVPDRVPGEILKSTPS